MTLRLSRLLSYVLRHRPDELGLELGNGGWVGVQALLEALHAAGHAVSEDDIAHLVETNDKQRFALSEDGTMIRANQGHSVKVDLGLRSVVPPRSLYHGTVPNALPGIRAGGLVPGKRHHVHLSPDHATAAAVGARRGKAVVLDVDSGAMSDASFVFYLSENGVWLTDRVPIAFIRFPGVS